MGRDDGFGKLSKFEGQKGNEQLPKDFIRI